MGNREDGVGTMYLGACVTFCMFGGKTWNFMFFVPVYAMVLIDDFIFCSLVVVEAFEVQDGIIKNPVDEIWRLFKGQYLYNFCIVSLAF